jgi:aspartyl-tRNA(Asn)/glutamyl-tRNA(Gln) amidotransferase subunit C
MKLTDADIKKIAKLSRLKLNDEEIHYHKDNLNNIFGWIDQLQEIDVSSVNLYEDLTEQQMQERKDEVTAPNRVTEILQNAPAKMHDMFEVPKVVE